MKRDPELIREILHAIEADQGSPLGWVELNIDGHSTEKTSYHVQLLADAGLVIPQDLSSSSGYHVMPKRMTSAGHDFLDAVRNEVIWSKVKAAIAETGSFTLSLIKELAISYAKQKLGLAA